MVKGLYSKQAGVSSAGLALVVGAIIVAGAIGYVAYDRFVASADSSEERSGADIREVKPGGRSVELMSKSERIEEVKAIFHEYLVANQAYPDVYSTPLEDVGDFPRGVESIYDVHGREGLYLEEYVYVDYHRSDFADPISGRESVVTGYDIVYWEEEKREWRQVSDSISTVVEDLDVSSVANRPFKEESLGRGDQPDLQSFAVTW